MEQLEFNILFHSFLGLGTDDGTWDRRATGRGAVTQAIIPYGCCGAENLGFARRFSANRSTGCTRCAAASVSARE